MAFYAKIRNLLEQQWISVNYFTDEKWHNGAAAQRRNGVMA
jgi:hypothetical protein